MSFISALAQTFQVTEFDVMVMLGMIGATLGLYYFYKIHTVFEAAFGAISWLSIYILLSVLLLWNGPLGTEGWLFPFGFSVFVVSVSVYLVFLLAVLFPLHGWLITTEPKEPILYSLQYFSTAFYLVFSLFSVFIYMIEQSYVFKVGTIFVVFRDMPYYAEVVKTSFIYSFIMSHQGIIIPLGVILMLYKLLLSNIINAALLSIWYNLSHVGFYRPKDDSHYRVEFHEVWWWHDDHADDHSAHDDHADAHGTKWHHH
jgi:hypothetical protein